MSGSGEMFSEVGAQTVSGPLLTDAVLQVVEPGDTLLDLKKRIFASHNFPPATQNFRFCDRCPAEHV